MHQAPVDEGAEIELGTILDVPTLGQWGLVGLAAALTLLSLATLRRLS